MQTIPANDLKTKGIPVIEDCLSAHDEAVISVRGKPRFVVMTIEAYDRLRELALDAALRESQADLAAGRFRTVHQDDAENGIAAHMARVLGA